MTDLHEIARQAVAAGDVDDRTADHVATCPSCAAFAARVERLADVAKLLAPAPAPPGLADRVLAAAPRQPRRLAGPVRGAVVRSLAVAAAALLVAGVAALLPRGEGGEHSLLLTAAEATEDAGSARVRVEGTTEVEAHRGDQAAPDFEAVPDEMQAYLERRWQELYAEFERQHAAFEAQVDATLDEAQRQVDRAMEDALRQFGGRAAPAAQPRPEPRPQGQPPRPPERVHVALTISAAGEVGFDGRLRLDGTVAAGQGRVGFEVRADRGRPWVRQPDGRWVEATDPSGALASLVSRPDGVARLLRSATGEGEVLGEDTLGGGVRVRHVRFTADGYGTAEAWIDGDDRVRRLTVHAAGALGRGSYRTTLTAHLADFGVPVAAPGRVAVSGRAAAPASPSRLVYPLGPAVAASLEAR